MKNLYHFHILILLSLIIISSNILIAQDCTWDNTDYLIPAHISNSSVGQYYSKTYSQTDWLNFCNGKILNSKLIGNEWKSSHLPSTSWSKFNTDDKIGVEYSQKSIMEILYESQKLVIKRNKVNDDDQNTDSTSYTLGANDVTISIIGLDNQQGINVIVKVGNASPDTIKNKFNFNNTKVPQNGSFFYLGECIYIHPFTINGSIETRPSGNITINIENINLQVPNYWNYAPSITILGCQNVNIRNCYFQSSMLTGGRYFLDIRSCINVFIDRVEVDGSIPSKLSGVNGGGGIIINKNFIDTNVTHSQLLDSSGTEPWVVVQNCYFHGYKNGGNVDGLATNNPGNGIVFNSYFSWKSDGLDWSYRSGVYNLVSRVERCIFDSCRDVKTSARNNITPDNSHKRPVIFFANNIYLKTQIHAYHSGFDVFHINELYYNDKATTNNESALKFWGLNDSITPGRLFLSNNLVYFKNSGKLRYIFEEASQCRTGDKDLIFTDYNSYINPSITSKFLFINNGPAYCKDKHKLSDFSNYSKCLDSSYTYNCEVCDSCATCSQCENLTPGQRSFSYWKASPFSKDQNISATLIYLPSDTTKYMFKLKNNNLVFNPNFNEINLINEITEKGYNKFLTTGTKTILGQTNISILDGMTVMHDFYKVSRTSNSNIWLNDSTSIGAIQFQHDCNNPPVIDSIHFDFSTSKYTVYTKSGGEPYNYQWLKDSVKIENATTPYFTPKDQGMYKCIVRNICGYRYITAFFEPKIYKISGTIKYNNQDSINILNTDVTLKTTEGLVLQTTNTGSGNTFVFNNIKEGNYKISCIKTDGWNGADPGDALMINRNYIGSYTFTDSLRKKSADVNEDKSIDPGDALSINRRYIGSILNFKKADWLFDSDSKTLTVNNNNITVNIRANCAGDVNGSFSDKKKSGGRMNNRNSQNSNTFTDINVCIDTIAATPGGDTIIPVYVKHFDNINAFGFRIQYDTTVLTFKNIEHINSLVTGLISNKLNDSLNIAWASSTGDSINLDSTKLFDIRFKYKGGYTDLTFLDASMVADDSIHNLDVTYNSGFIKLAAGIPYITLQPSFAVKYYNESAAFRTTAISTTTLSYQWFKNDTIQIAGATDSIYDINNVDSSKIGKYKCVISNIYGSVTSDTASLKVKYNPHLYKQPVNLSLCAGTDSSFSVAAYGATPLNYQWLKNDTVISSATNSQFTIYNIQLVDTGFFKCIVSNVYGRDTSLIAGLYVSNTVPTITLQPVSDTVCRWTSYEFQLSTINNGNSFLSYHWYKNNETLSGNYEYLYLSNLTENNAGIYKCNITNSCGSVTSDTVSLSVNAPITITEQPDNLDKCVGSSSSFSVTSLGTRPLTYQWYKNDTTTISGAVDSIYTIINVDSLDTGKYKCIINNTCASRTTLVVTLTVAYNAAYIAQQPVSDTVCPGTNKIFSITPGGDTPLKYKWYQDNEQLSIENGELGIENVSISDAGNYNCIINNACGGDTSGYARLLVNTPPVITQQPISDTVCYGTQLVLGALVSGSIPYTHQWFKDGSYVSADSLYDATYNYGASYQYVVTNICGSDTSQLMVIHSSYTAPTIWQDLEYPYKTIKCDSTEITYTVAAYANGNVPLTYKWYKNDTILIEAAVDSLLTLSNLALVDSGYYKCVISNVCGSTTTNSSHLIVSSAPVITVQPISDTLCTEETITFSIYATGTGTLSYQWKKDDVNITDATDSSYLINSLITDDTGLYTCIVTDDCGVTISDAATLGVNQEQTTVLNCPGGGEWDNVVSWGGEFSDHTEFYYSTLTGGYNTAEQTASSLEYLINYEGLFDVENCGDGVLYLKPLTPCRTYTEYSSTINYTSNPSPAPCNFSSRLISNSSNEVTVTTVDLYPNPNDGSFNIDVALPEDEDVTFESYSILGEKVLSEIHSLKAGLNKLNLKIINPASGIYFIQIKAGNDVFTKKIIVK